MNRVKKSRKVLASTVLAGWGSNIAGYTKKLKMKLAGAVQKFARFAKSGNKIINLATLATHAPPG